MITEGSGAGSRSIPRTTGSGSRRPKTIQILRIRLPIRNTAYVIHFLCPEGGAPEDGVSPRVLRVREVLSVRQASQNAQGNAAQLRWVYTAQCTVHT